MGTKAVLRRYHLDELPRDFVVRNDRIKDVTITANRGFMLSLGVDYESGAQGVGFGHHNTHNIGHMIVAMAEVLGVNLDGVDIIKELIGTPIRVAFKFDPGGMVVDDTYIGNFMKDEFFYFKELVEFGLPDGGGK